MRIIVPISQRIFARSLWQRLIVVLAALALIAGPLHAAIKVDGEKPSAPATEHVEAAVSGDEAHGEAVHEEGLPKKALPIGGANSIGPTNSMVVTWLVALGVILFAQIATKNIKQVPEGMQNFWEFLVEGLYNFLESIIGKELVKKTFWFFATVFIFILFTNWCGLIPGVGTIGWGHPNEQGALEHIARPLFRGANADLNMTFAMSIIFFGCWIVWAIQANGVGGFILHIFGPKGNTTGFMKAMMVVVFVIVGLLEVVSILFRPVSLSFRLFGNIFAGENLLESMSHLVPGLAWLIPIPFYFMELLVGIVQALVFMLLTAAFTLLICSHEEGHDDHGKAHGAGH